jgi:hypothetical protein
VLSINAHSICANAGLREAGDFMRQLLSHIARLAVGGESFARTDAVALFRSNLAAREDDVERASLTKR